MNPDRYQVICETFRLLLPLDTESRAGRLATIRTDDPDMASSVESMLASDEDLREALQDEVIDQGRDRLEQLLDQSKGDEASTVHEGYIGPHRIIEVLG